jgi:Cu2+-containing amine oxidase
VDWIFVWVTLKEPEKSIMLPYFLNDTDYPPIGSVPRKALIIGLHPQTAVTYEGTVNLDSGVLESWIGVEGVDPSFAADEMDYIADLVLEEPLILERLSLYGPFYGNKSNVITDVW